MHTEELQLVTAALKNNQLAARDRELLKLVHVLNICLLQQERLLIGSPEFSNKEDMIHCQAAARILSEKIA